MFSLFAFLDITGPVNTTSDKWLWVPEALAALFFIILIIFGIFHIKIIIEEIKKNKK